MSAKPPGAGWQPIPGGSKNGFRKLVGGRWAYWYPEKGVVDEHGQRHEGSLPKGHAKGEAESVDHTNEVDRARKLVERVIANLGAGLTPKQHAELDLGRIETIKRKIGRATTLEEIHALQDQARAEARRVGDLARNHETRQTGLFAKNPEPEPEPRELTPGQVEERAAEALRIGQERPEHYSRYMTRLEDAHGPVEARKVADHVGHHQRAPVPASAPSAPRAPETRPPAPKPRSEAPQLSLFGMAAAPKGAQGDLFDRGAGLSKAAKTAPGQLGLFEDRDCYRKLRGTR